MKKFYSLILLLSLGVLTFGQTTIWSEDFESYATNTGVDGDGNSGDYPASVSKWSLDVLGAGMDNDEDWFYTNTAASSCQMQARDVGGIVIFISETINISTYTNVSISLDVSADGGMESTDYAKASYKIDGGSITQFGYANDDFTSTTFSVSALSGSSLIIYVELKNGAADEYHQFDNMLVTGTSTSIDPEPSNPISSFSAVANGSGQIDLSWNDNDGAQVAAGVLIRANLNGTFSDPVDGTAEADDTNMTDGQGLVNIAHGVQAYSFTGLSPNTTYYFKAFTYTNSGVNINYKTDGTPSTTNATTEAATGETLIISEVADPNDDYSARFVELYNAGASTIDFDTETWYLCFQANGGNFTNKQLSGKIYPGETYVTSYSISAFPANYSFVSDFQTGFNGSGDDGYFLYKNGDQTSGSLIDAYGVLDEDGTGKTWEYTNKQAKRKNGILNANSTWTASEWDIVSANVADMNPGSHLLCVGWNGKSSTDWNTTANWSGELAPTSSNHVKIPTGCTYYPTLNTDKSIQNLFVKSKQSSTASIIEAGHLSINQNVYVERYMEDYSSTSNGWHFLSSPLANFLIAGSDFAPEAGVDDLFRFGESNNSWLNYTGGSFGQTQLETGLGYLVSYSSQSTKTFNGSTLAGSSSISKNLSYTSGVGNGWNLLGNPYLSAIDWDDITKTSQMEIFRRVRFQPCKHFL
ncbi:MAG: hypothetical protein B7C24_14430 [Bacteroidetes bacterium 4572_77]|nr:MAG: hypothetical protein B7C24_14430 [Bacteroidetes bacterium 4572_77]